MSVHAHAGLCARMGAHILCHARWDRGDAAAPRTCAVLLSPVRGMAGGNTTGCRNNVASCTAGNSPKGEQGLRGSRGHGCAAWGPSCPLGMGHVALQGCLDGVAVPCVCVCLWPAVTMCMCCSLQAYRHERATKAGGQEVAWALAAPPWRSCACQYTYEASCDVCMHGSPFMPFAPGHWGLHPHAPWHAAH